MAILQLSPADHFASPLLLPGSSYVRPHRADWGPVSKGLQVSHMRNAA